ncbi:NAD(P)-dependent alcohol dehydrogenase [Mycobacterium sp. 3519A]|uniref:NAD(P)-dependent alcohol dehydrogenase n=1 Tax=Mycobacterium sp. 3519A TaxID=2057184 RepID=UPI000C7B305A|nr:NAD(P)-dependent alcohol dehydrogenase [Mycobacterium sp. 3519A]
MRITAAVSRSPDSPFTVETVDLDAPRADEVLVRIRATGVCHTDLSSKARIPVPAVLGHEGAGVVEVVGAAVAGLAPGDHVVLSYRSCGECGQCRAGHRPYCVRSQQLNSSGRRVDGSATLSQNGTALFGAFFGQSSFAQYALASPDNVVVVDPSVDLTLAAPLGCGFQTGAGAVLNVLTPEPDSRLVVFGAGGVGLAAVMAAKAIGVETVVAVDPVASRRAKAAELGASGTVDPATEDVAATVRGATHALDTTALPDVVATALSVLQARGVLAVVGLGARHANVDMIDLMLQGKTIRGCVEGDANPSTFIPRLLDLHADGRFPMQAIVRRYDAHDIETAVADARSGDAIKPVLVW